MAREMMRQAVSRMDLSSEETRAASVERIRQAQEAERNAGLERARELGLAVPAGAWVDGVTPGGVPRIIGLDNANAAISTAVTAARNRSEYASLTGSGMVIGEWDGGTPRTTHQEYGSRLVLKQAGLDTGVNHFHATFVAGTLVGSGVDSAAAGMAPGATLWYWNSDYALSEMTGVAAKLASEAVASTRLMISNHSYGAYMGWGKPGDSWTYFGPAGTTEDPGFGYYGEESQQIDQLCLQAPYYLPFFSAGNQRGEGPATGDTVILAATGETVTYDPNIHPGGDSQNLGFDTMGSDKNFKNALAVGAVTDAVSGGGRSLAGVVPTSFSSFGPADDGRVKPDLVANGDNLYSAKETADNAYIFRSGTSAAAPNAAGSALLVQQFHKDQFNSALLNFELKGLLIHSADDLGRPGPDYENGWGLINTERALDLLALQKNNPGGLVRRTSYLAQNWKDSWQTTLTTPGFEPLKLTLCWNDPAATPIANNPLNDRTKSLVHDLDLRLETTSGVVVGLPWRLNPISPANNATTGDNNTDNVEQIVAAVPSGTYVVKVTHKGTLSSPQGFSLTVSGNQVGTPTAPALSVAGDDVDIFLPEGSRGPSGTVTVRNTGIGTLNYTLTSSVPWIVPAVTSGSSTGEADAITVNLETQGLVYNISNAIQNGTLTVSAPGLISKTIHFTVRLMDGMNLADVSPNAGLVMATGGTGDPMKIGWDFSNGFLLRTGRMAANQTSTLTATVTGAGLLEFPRRMEGGAGNVMEVMVDGAVVLTNTGPQPEAVIQQGIATAGAHTVQIRYRQGSSAPDFKDGLRLLALPKFYRNPELPATLPDLYGEGGTVDADFTFNGYATILTTSLAGLTVSGDLQKLDSTATHSGHLHGTGIPAGNHTVTVTAAGYTGATDTVTFVLHMVADTGFSGPDIQANSNSQPSDAAWVTVTSPSHDGVDAAQSGSITHNQESAFSITLTAPATVSWWWKVSSEANYDKLSVYQDGAPTALASLSGEQNWVQQTITIPYSSSGSSIHILRFVYAKDVSLSVGQDKAWVDQVVVNPLPYVKPGTPEVPDFVGGQAGKPLAYYLRPENATYLTSLNVDQLPPGLTLNTSKRSVEGTPSASSTLTSTFTLTGAGGSTTWTVDWSIAAAGLSLASGLGDTHVSASTDVSGGWYAVPHETVSGGIALDPSHAVRSGVIGEGATSTLTLNVSGRFALRLLGSVSSRSGDELSYVLDGAAPVAIPHDHGFYQDISSTADVAHILRLIYTKDSDGRIEEQDGVWLQIVRLETMPAYSGDAVWNAFQGQFFRAYYTTTPSGGQFAAASGAPTQDLFPAVPGLSFGTTPDGQCEAGTPTTLGSTLSQFRIYKYGYVPAQVTVTVNPTVALAGSIEWTALLLYPVSTGGEQPWFGQTVVRNDGVDAARAGTVSADGQSWMQFGVPGDALFRWRWKVSSEANYDKLAILLDGEEMQSISGEQDWSTQTLKVPPGSHTVRFVYQKDGTVTQGLDTGWVDTAEYIVPPTLLTPTSLGTNVGAALNSQITGIWLGNAAYAATGLPPGVSIHPATGAITGAPTSAGVFAGTVTATTEAGTTSMVLTITVNATATSAVATDFSGSSWAAVRNQPGWFGQTVVTHDGVDALQSGFIPHAQVVGETLIPSLTTTSIQLSGPGVLTFWSKVDSEANYDFFRVEVDGTVNLKQSGNVPWGLRTVEIQPGSHRVAFVYEKDTTVSTGLDAAWIDQVVFTPGPVPPPFAISSLQFSGPHAYIHFPSRAGFTYRCEYSQNLQAWSQLPFSTIQNGTGSPLYFIHVNASPSTSEATML